MFKQDSGKNIIFFIAEAKIPLEIFIFETENESLPHRLSDINPTNFWRVYISDIQETKTFYFVCFDYAFKLKVAESGLELYYPTQLFKTDEKNIDNDNEQEIRYLPSTESFYMISFNFDEGEGSDTRIIIFHWFEIEGISINNNIKDKRNNLFIDEKGILFFLNKQNEIEVIIIENTLKELRQECELQKVNEIKFSIEKNKVILRSSSDKIKTKLIHPVSKIWVGVFLKKKLD